MTARSRVRSPAPPPRHEREEPTSRFWGRKGQAGVLRAALGFAHVVRTITPERGAPPLAERAKALAERDGVRVPTALPRVSVFRAPRGVALLSCWWKPAARPVRETDPILAEATAQATASRFSLPQPRPPAAALCR
jgi:hypothetical protein